MKQISPLLNIFSKIYNITAIFKDLYFVTVVFYNQLFNHLLKNRPFKLHTKLISKHSMKKQSFKLCLSTKTNTFKNNVLHLIK